MWLICSLFGFFCAPGAEPGRAEFEARQRAALPPITGRASVSDGDTLEIGGRRIRLQGIDAPESGQFCENTAGKPWRCGQAAALELERVIGARTVTCVQDPRDPEDRYGRALAMCGAGGEDLQLALLRTGLALAYRRYLDYRDGTPRPYRAAYLAAEAEAVAAKRGMHAGRFISPEAWRAARRLPSAPAR